MTANLTYSLFLFLAGLLCLMAAWVVWQRRKFAIAAWALWVVLLALAFWDFTYAIFWTGAVGPTPHFWLDITYVGVVSVPTAFFIFACQLVKWDAWLTRKTLLLLTVEPLLVQLLLWTDPWHNLFFGGKRAFNTGVILDAGPVFWLNVVYSYSLSLITTWIIGRALLKSSGIFRKQIAWVFMGLLITWISSLILVTGMNPLPDADNTPFSFTLTALIFTFALTRYRLFDIVPIARDRLIESMSDGLMVVDTNCRLIDLNPAGRRSIAALENLQVGASTEEIFKNVPGLLEKLALQTPVSTEFRMGSTPARYLDIHLSPLFDERQWWIGHLIVWRDVTERRRLEEELQRQATTDGLTGIYNRRYFTKLAQNELKRAARFGYPLAIVLVDIDYFKQVNDHYGHSVGDQVLIAFTRLCQAYIRETDVLARLGGDEFVLLLPETDRARAAVIAERLRAALAQPLRDVANLSIQITASFGVAGCTTDLETVESLMIKADLALYEAKGQGRNCVAVGEEPGSFSVP